MPHPACGRVGACLRQPPRSWFPPPAAQMERALLGGGIAIILALTCRSRAQSTVTEVAQGHGKDDGGEEEQDRAEAEILAAEEAGVRKAQRQDAALIKAAGAGDEDALRELLDQGADPDADNEHDWTALHAAATKGHEECVAVLVEAGATVDAEDGGCSTPLMAAARGGHVEVVRLLLQCGADIAKRDGIGNRGGRTALSRARRAGKHDVVALLDGWATQRPRVDNLEAAAKTGDAMSVREMLANGVDPDATNSTLWTALHQAAQKGHVDCTYSTQNVLPLPACLPVCLSVCLAVSLSRCLAVSLPVCLSV